MTSRVAAPRPERTKTKNRSGTALRRRNTAIGWSFILPNFIGFGFLTFIPIVALFYISLTDWNALSVGEWVGASNFERLLNDPLYWTAMRNTVYYVVVHLPLTLVLSLGLALLLNQKVRGVAFFRTAAFFPYISSVVAIAVVWNLLFSPDSGPINQVLRAFGMTDTPGWTVSTEWAMPAVIIVGTWREMGYYMLLFLAGLQTIPRELYEAAHIDGANAWQRFVNVTWPGLRPTTFFVTVMLTIGSFKVFDLILVMTEGGPGTSTLVLSQYVFNKGFGEYDFGYASAVAISLFLICLAVTIVQHRVNHKGDL